MSSVVFVDKSHADFVNVCEQVVERLKRSTIISKRQSARGYHVLSTISLDRARELMQGLGVQVESPYIMQLDPNP